MRMSVVVKAPDGKILVLTKGADSVMISRNSGYAMNVNSSAISEAQSDNSSSSSSYNNVDLAALLAKHIHEFASEGLRTLVLAQRELDVKTFKEFQTLWSQAETATIGKHSMSCLEYMLMHGYMRLRVVLET